MSLLIDPLKHFGRDLSQIDGHIFIVPSPETLKELINKITNFDLLPPGQIQILQAISQTDSQYVTVHDIETYLKYSRHGINKFITKMNNSAVLIKTDFELTSGKKLPRNKCFCIPHQSEFTNLFSELELIKRNKVNNRSKAHIEPSKKLALKQLNLPSCVRENNVNQGLFFSNLPPFERMLPDRSYKKNNYISTIYLQQKKVIVAAKSPNRIMNSDDMKTLYTLMTLSINQQANMIDYYRASNSPLLNSHYIEIRHIMKVLGKPAAGSYYDSFVNSVIRIKETFFDLHQLETMYMTTDGDDLFVGEEFRFFSSCKSLSKQGATIFTDKDNNQTINIKPFGFIIAWNESLFKKMLMDRYFFVIPLKILAAPTIIFLFYMALRNYFSFDRKKTWTLSADELHKKLNSSARIDNFKRDLISGLDSLIEGKNALQRNGGSQIDMQGFLITVKMSKNVLTQLICTIDVDKMLAYAGVTSPNTAHKNKVMAAPTTANPLIDLLPIIEFKELRGSELPQESHMRLLMNPKELLKNINIVKSKHFFSVKKNDHNHRITTYSDDSEVLSICEIVHESPHDQSAFFAHLCSLRNKLNPLNSGNASNQEELSLEQFTIILDGLCKIKAIIIERIELFDILFNRAQLISAACKWDGKAENSTLLNSIFSLYSHK